MPSIGACLLAGLAVDCLWGCHAEAGEGTGGASLKKEKARTARRWFAVALVSVAVAASVWRCHARNAEWRDELSIYRATIRDLPNNAKAHHNYATALGNAPETFDEATRHLRRALQLHPDYASAYNNLGVALSLRGTDEDVDEAVEVFRAGLESVRRNPIVGSVGETLRRNLQRALAEQQRRQQRQRQRTQQQQRRRARAG